MPRATRSSRTLSVNDYLAMSQRKLLVTQPILIKDRNAIVFLPQDKLPQFCRVSSIGTGIADQVRMFCFETYEQYLEYVGAEFSPVFVELAKLGVFIFADHNQDVRTADKKRDFKLIAESFFVKRFPRQVYLKQEKLGVIVDNSRLRSGHFFDSAADLLKFLQFEEGFFHGQPIIPPPSVPDFSFGGTLRESHPLAPLNAITEGLTQESGWERHNALYLIATYPVEHQAALEEVLAPFTVKVKSARAIYELANYDAQLLAEQFATKGLTIEVVDQLAVALNGPADQNFMLLQIILDEYPGIILALKNLITKSPKILDIVPAELAAAEIPELLLTSSSIWNILSSVAKQASPSRTFRRSDRFEVVEPSQDLVSLPDVLSYFRQSENGNVGITLPSQKETVLDLDTFREGLFRDGKVAGIIFGRPMLTRAAEWGDTIAGGKCGVPTLNAFNGWADQVPETRGTISLQRSEHLRSLLDPYGLSLKDESGPRMERGGQLRISNLSADILEAVFSLFNEATFGAGPQYLNTIAVNASRRQCARISAYGDGLVALYPYVMKNFWHLPAVAVHEIGHSLGARVFGAKQGKSSPDKNIPEPVRQAFIENLRSLPPTLDQFVVDYVYGRDLRLSYVSSGEELVADLHVMYVYNGQAIRDYINSGEDSYSVAAWRNVYEFMRQYAFDGREFAA